MRVRLRLDADGEWIVETKCWYDIGWEYERRFWVGDVDKKAAYEQAKKYAQNLKYPKTEEIK
jgi:5,10-methylene-tetrahydrofolate dehydrogenase/methenyl tetrahydrofolate cyclohydrolase